LPPVSTTLAKLVAKFATATGVFDTGSAPLLTNISGNFENIRNGPKEYSGAGGKLINEKNQKQKSRDTVPLMSWQKVYT
jgi:hypothetical protein